MTTTLTVLKVQGSESEDSNGGGMDDNGESTEVLKMCPHCNVDLQKDGKSP